MAFKRSFVATSFAPSSTFSPAFTRTSLFSQSRVLMGAGFATASGDAYDRSKPHFNICTIGHVDHGKTTLTASITKNLADQGLAKFMRYDEIDKAEEEKRRGITINTAHVEYSTPQRHYAHVDNPGHAEFIKNMITGTATTDAAILVVDCSVGPMPQTREHILLARQTGITNIIVWLNKCDLVPDKELVEMVEMEIREELTKYKFDGKNAIVIHGSAMEALEGKETEYGKQAIRKLLESMDNLPLPAREVDKDFIMAVEGLYDISGRGVVATGVVEQGRVKMGDSVEIVGMKSDKKPYKAKVTGIETFHKSLDHGEAGESVGVLLGGMEKEKLKKGQVLCKPNTLKAYKKFGAQAYVLSKDEGGRHTPVSSNYAPQIFLRTANLTAKVLIPDNKVAMPGEDTKMTIETIWPVCVHPGQKFSLREGGKTVAAGIVTEVFEDDADDKKKDDKKAPAGKAGAGAAKPGAGAGAAAKKK